MTLHKTPSLTSGWVLALWPPGSRNWTVAVCVLTGREANSSKHLLSFATPTQKPSVDSLPDEPTAPVMWEDLQPFRKRSLWRFRPERTAINQKKKTSMLIQNLPVYVLKLPWNGKTMSGVGEGGGVWCVISPRPPAPQSSPNSLLSIYYLSWSDGVIISPASGYGKWPHALFTHAKMLIDDSFIYIFPQCRSYCSYFFFFSPLTAVILHFGCEPSLMTLAHSDWRFDGNAVHLLRETGANNTQRRGFSHLNWQIWGVDFEKKKKNQRLNIFEKTDDI